MNLIEPQRGQLLLTSLNTTVANSDTLTTIVPILADIFVFSYPLLLVVWYITGIVKHNKEYKSDSLTVGFGAAYVTAINMIIQSIWYKDRPIFAEGNTINLILNELPSAAFPSDHAAVSMIVGLLTVILGYQRKNTLLKTIGFILIICSIIMSVSRVAVGVHWPTDILAGWGVAIMIAIILQLPSIKHLQETYINHNLIKLQEWLLKPFIK